MNNVPAEKQTSSQSATPFLIAVPVAFIVIGTTLAVSLLRDFLFEISIAERAVEVPCKIVSAEIETNRGNHASSRSPKIVYEYQYNFQDFSSETLEFSSGKSSRSCVPARMRLAALKNRTTCWVDPENPRKSALERPIYEFSWSKIFPIFFSLIFAVLGVSVSVLVFTGIRKEKAKLAAAGTQIPENSVPATKPWNAAPAGSPPWLAKIVSLYWLIFPIVWLAATCFIAGTFICVTWPENTPISRESLGEFFSENFVMLVFLASFIVVGITFAFVNVRKFIADRRAAERSRDEAFARNRGKWER